MGYKGVYPVQGVVGNFEKVVDGGRVTGGEGVVGNTGVVVLRTVDLQSVHFLHFANCCKTR